MPTLSKVMIRMSVLDTARYNRAMVEVMRRIELQALVGEEFMGVYYPGPLHEYFNSRHPIQELESISVFDVAAQSFGYAVALSFHKAEIYNFRTLCILTDADLLAIPRIGRRRLRFLRDLMSHMGLDETALTILRTCAGDSRAQAKARRGTGMRPA